MKSIENIIQSFESRDALQNIIYKMTDYIVNPYLNYFT